MLWVVVMSVIFMMVNMMLGAKLGSVTSANPGDLIRQTAGRWLSVLAGLCVFFISASIQSGKDVGVASALEAFVDSPPLVVGLVVVFNVIAISFLFAFRNLYKVLERLMMAFVGVMLVGFAVHLFALKPDAGAMVRGFVPSVGNVDLAVLGLVGTTFVITAAGLGLALLLAMAINTAFVKLPQMIEDYRKTSAAADRDRTCGTIKLVSRTTVRTLHE